MRTAHFSLSEYKNSLKKRHGILLLEAGSGFPNCSEMLKQKARTPEFLSCRKGFLHNIQFLERVHLIEQGT